MAVYGDKLFCVYVDEFDVWGQVKFMFKTESGGWSAPVDLGPRIYASQAPAIFTLAGTLYVFVVVRGADGSSECWRFAYDDATGQFIMGPLPSLKKVTGSPSFVEMNGMLYMFYIRPNKIIAWRKTTDLTTWSDEQWVYEKGSDPVPSLSAPTVIWYQGLIHVFATDTQGNHLLLKFDGGSNWTRPRLFIPEKYSNAPSAVVHNGLLNIVFNGLVSDPDNRDLFQYCYDGSCTSPATVSSNLRATQSIGLGVLADRLYAVYRGSP
ncbi:sialidase family protein [Pseudomonas huaxiensis]|uniref:sialidase family protein n=1 Tax=Pseudomonas huaxiensis TaxID=2213017 RepID=UPI000DA6671A|nr:sialidase family protein [Pseudomonas huaxiensis]